MIQKSEVCVLLPAYNEEKNIERVIAAVRSRGYAVLVVDDGSTDTTAQKVLSSGVSAVFATVNAGKGATLAKGLEKLRHSDFKAVVLMDSDGQHDPEEIGRFVEALEKGADLVIGDRMADTKDMPFIRVATNRVMSWIISGVAGQKVADTQSGYRAFSRKAVDRIRLKASRFETESEMIFSAADAGLRIASVPITCLYGDEVSHIRPVRDTLRFFNFLIRYLATRDRLKAQLNQER